MSDRGMTAGWENLTLGDVVTLKRGYDLPKRLRKEGCTPLISSSGRSDTHSESKVKGPGVITGRYGTIGEVFYSEEDFWPLNTTLYVQDFKGNDPKFIYYFLKTIKYSEYSDKAAVPGVNRNHLHMAQVRLPTNLTEQKAIAHILGSVDDKIELNRQINETLEAMAQALFKSWFVDFDPVIDNALAAGNAIPDVFAERAKQRAAAKKPEKQSTSATAINDSSNYQHLFPAEFEFTEEMGWVPLGWEVSQISGFGKVVTGKTPPKNIEDAYSDSGVPFITPTDVDDSVFVFSTNRFLSVQGQESVKKSKLPSGSICVTCIGSQMGKTSIAPFESFSNQQINAIVGCDEVWRNYLFFNLRGRKEEIFLMGSSGSTMPIVNKSTFEKLEVLRPTDNLVAVLGDSFKAPVDTILSNTAENNILAKLRDTLLPKLLSGELRIPDAEKLVQEALL